MKKDLRGNHNKPGDAKMQYLRIVSPKECSVDAFITLGISTSRAHSNLIGEFGSGAKHAMLVCLRHGINPIVFCGTQRLVFHTEPEEEPSSGEIFHRVYVKIGKRNPERLSVVAEYGAKDWDNLGMALREFVSNAIDGAGGTTQGVSVKVCEKVNPQAGKTVVGIPLTPEVSEWYGKLPLYFMHFRKSMKDDMEKKVLRKKKPDRCFVYRKGVLVRTAQTSDDPSLFDYNLGDELKIDEARNLSDYQMRDEVARVVSTNDDCLVEIFRKLPGDQRYWEFALPEWDLSDHARHNQELWKGAWRLAHGNAVVAMGYSPLCDSAKQRGHDVVIVPQGNWLKAIEAAGIPSLYSVLDDVNIKGDKMLEPTDEDKKVFDTVWAWLELVDLTRGKAKPNFTLYERVQTDDSQIFGYCLGKTIHIHLEHRANHQTYLEEIAHYVTNASDCTRSFQEYAFKAASKLALAAGLG